VGSKKRSKENVTFKIIKDQKREKLRIKLDFDLSTKNKRKQANKGKSIRDNNIVLKTKKK